MEKTGAIITYKFKTFNEMQEFVTGKGRRNRYIEHKDGREVIVTDNDGYKNALFLENFIGANWTEKRDLNNFTNLTALNLNNQLHNEFRVSNFIGYEKVGKAFFEDKDEVFILEIKDMNDDTTRETYKTFDGAVKGALDFMRRFYGFGDTIIGMKPKGKTEEEVNAPYIGEEQLKELQTALENGLRECHRFNDYGVTYKDEFGDKHETDVFYYIHDEKVLG